MLKYWTKLLQVFRHAFGQENPEWSEITVEELFDRFDSDPPALLIDIRSVEDYTKGYGHIPNSISIPLLEKARLSIIDARFCILIHPSGETFVSWLNDIGFREVIPSHSGAEFAGQLFDRLPEKHHPKDIKALDTMLQPLVRIVIQMAAPLSVDPMITAIK